MENCECFFPKNFPHLFSIYFSFLFWNSNFECHTLSQCNCSRLCWWVCVTRLVAQAAMYRISACAILHLHAFIPFLTSYFNETCLKRTHVSVRSMHGHFFFLFLLNFDFNLIFRLVLFTIFFRFHYSTQEMASEFEWMNKLERVESLNHINRCFSHSGYLFFIQTQTEYKRNKNLTVISNKLITSESVITAKILSFLWKLYANKRCMWFHWNMLNKYLLVTDDDSTTNTSKTLCIDI